MKYLLLVFFMIICHYRFYAQNIGIGTETPEPSAILDVNSNTQGFLIPRMTRAERDAITNPDQSLLIFQTDDISGFYYFEGTVWKLMGYADIPSPTASQLIINCPGNTTTLTATGAAASSGGIINWYSDLSLTTLLGTGSPFTTPPISTTTTFYVREELYNSNSAIIPVNASVLTASAAPTTTTPVTYFETQDVILTGTGSGTGDLVFYNSSSVELGRIAMAGTATQSYNAGQMASGNYTYYVSEDNGICESNKVSIDVSVIIYPVGSVHCINPPTARVDVVSTTGKTWMDRNLGASQVASSSTDTASYGDLYQWGRFSDGHQCRTSGYAINLSSSDQPGHGDFIMTSQTPHNWRSPQNDNLWQGVNGINNPCPGGYRLPTEAEFDAERASWGSNNAAGALASPLKLPMGGNRSRGNGSFFGVGTRGRYWSSTVSSTNSLALRFLSTNAGMVTFSRAGGLSVRCLKE
jgi:uncharacterized protein (TIGR02145 family)